MSDKGDFLTGLVVGGLIGLTVGVLFAPGPGDEMRSAVRDRATDAMDRVRDLGDQMRDGVDRVRDGVNQAAGSVRQRFGSAEEPSGDEAPADPTT